MPINRSYGAERLCARVGANEPQSMISTTTEPRAVSNAEAIEVRFLPSPGPVDDQPLFNSVEDLESSALAIATGIVNAYFASYQNVDDGGCSNGGPAVIRNQTCQDRHFLDPPDTSSSFTCSGLIFFRRRRFTLSSTCALRRSIAAFACGSIFSIRPSKL